MTRASNLVHEVISRASQRRDPRWWARTLSCVSAGLTLGAPLSLVTPKRARSIAIVGRSGAGFVDNAKYFFLHLCQRRPDGVDPVFITEDRRTCDALRVAGLPALRYPSVDAAAALLRARVMVIDNVLPNTALRYYLALASKKVQLLHGVGFKGLPRFEWFPVYDLLTTTSAAYGEEVYGPPLLPKAIAITGYPRTDLLLGGFDDAEAQALVALGTDAVALDKIREARAQGLKVVLWAPTFRNDPALDQRVTSALDPVWLERVGQANGWLWVLKLHPNTRTPEVTTPQRHVVNYDSRADVYPALSLVDALLTEYSSIYMDYLLLDRPVLFYPFDRADYLTRDWGMIFDYDWIAPGPKCRDLDDVEAQLQALLAGGEDPWREPRRAVRDFAFAQQDGRASERVWTEIRERFLD